MLHDVPMLSTEITQAVWSVWEGHEAESWLPDSWIYDLLCILVRQNLVKVAGQLLGMSTYTAKVLVVDSERFSRLQTCFAFKRNMHFQQWFPGWQRDFFVGDRRGYFIWASCQSLGLWSKLIQFDKCYVLLVTKSDLNGSSYSYQLLAYISDELVLRWNYGTSLSVIFPSCSYLVYGTCCHVHQFSDCNLQLRANGTDYNIPTPNKLLKITG